MSNIVLSHHASEQAPTSPYYDNKKMMWKKLDDIAATHETADNERMLSLMERYRKSGAGNNPAFSSVLPFTTNEQVQQESLTIKDGNGNDDIEQLECRLAQILDEADIICSSTTHSNSDGDDEDDDDNENDNDKQQEENELPLLSSLSSKSNRRQQRRESQTFGFECDETWDVFVNDLPLES